MAAPAARPDAMRRHNLALILAQVHRDGALTRAELTARLGLSRSTIGALVADLVELGLVEESVPSGGTRAGRPSHVVGPSRLGPYVVAVDVDVTHLTFAAIGLGGEVRARRAIALSATPSPEQAAALIVDSIPALAREAGLVGRPVSIGVSVPGTVDRNTGTVGFAPNLAWRDAEFGSLLADLAEPHVPVLVGNDADLAVLAEHIRGIARERSDVVFLMGRIGVGAGIIVNGVPLRGIHGHAGEIGHNVVDPGGPECHCGKRGCLETFVGDHALLDLAGRNHAQTDQDTEEVFAAAHLGDEQALRAVRAVAASLGQALGLLVNTLNPELIVLGGSFGEVLSIAREDIEAALDRYVFNGPGEQVVLATPGLGVDSALIGAAEIAFAQLITDPLGGRALAAR
jgi:predicted NBD/HSP70 family sugar kinase